MIKKCIIIGSPGSGKSTFARGLRKKTGLPIFYLDRMFWKEDRTTVTNEEFDRRLNEVLIKEEWIIDGNYQRTMELRVKECDTIVFLDYPVEICIEGIRERFGKPREDMPWIETESDPEFLHFINKFRDENRPKIMEHLSKITGKNIVILHSREQATQFLEA